MSENHVYLAVDCKTKGCNVQHLVKYMGVREPKKAYWQKDLKAKLRIPCNVCHTTHDYAEVDVKPVLGPVPPHDFTDSL